MSGNYVYKEYDNRFDRDDAVNEYRQQCPECGDYTFIACDCELYDSKCKSGHNYHVHAIGDIAAVFVTNKQAVHGGNTITDDSCDVCTGKRVYDSKDLNDVDDI